MKLHIIRIIINSFWFIRFYSVAWLIPFINPYTQSMAAIIHRFIEITINRNVPLVEKTLVKKDITTFFLIFCFYFLGPIYTNRLLLGIGIIIQIMWTCYIAFGFCVLDEWNKDGVMLYFKLYGWVWCVFFLSFFFFVAYPPFVYGRKV